MARVIVVTSGKGGVGKTTVTANLGRALAMMGQRVVMLDTDLGLNNLDVLMGVENMVVYDIIDVVENRCRPRQALIEDTFAKGLFILPSAHSYDKSCISGQNIKAVIRALSGFDYVLIDCPAGIEAGFHRAVQAAGEAIVVTTPHISSIRDADKVISIIKSYRLEQIHLVVNRVRGDMVLSAETVSPEDVADLLKTEITGILPEDDNINTLGNAEYCLRGEGSDAIKILAQNIQLGTREMYDATRKYRGFWGNIKRNLRKLV